MTFDPERFFTSAGAAPPIAKLLGWKLLDYDEDRKWIRVGFDPKPEFLNPAGIIQGGMLAAMLDDTLGPAVIVASKGTLYTSTIDLHTHFMRPVKLGPVTTEATVTKLGSKVAFTEGTLFDMDGKLCVRATSSASLGPVPSPK